MGKRRCDFCKWHGFLPADSNDCICRHENGDRENLGHHVCYEHKDDFSKETECPYFNSNNEEMTSLFCDIVQKIKPLYVVAKGDGSVQPKACVPRRVLM